jgi:hypothetical protein
MEILLIISIISPIVTAILMVNGYNNCKYKVNKHGKSKEIKFKNCVRRDIP